MNDFIIEKSDNIKYINETLSQLLTRKSLLEKEYNELKSEVSLSMLRVSLQPEAKEVLDYMQWQEHEESVGAYERLLSAFMEEVLPGYRKVIFELTTERNSPALHIFIKKGENMPPEDALMGTGGSVTNILVTGLRIISLLRSNKRKFLVLDEPDCWLNPDYIPAFSKVINEMAQTLGVQIFLISHYVNSTFNGIDHKVLLFRDGNKLDTRMLGEVPVWEDEDEGIRSIRLRDFQAHTDTYIPLSPGVTLLMGDNDIGKSSIVTSLRSIFYGKGNKTNIKHFCDKATVTVEFTGKRLLFWERNNKGKHKESYIMLDENHDIDNPLHRTDGATLPEWLMEETGIGLIDGLDIQLAWQKEPLSLLGEAPPIRAKALAVGSEGSYVQGMVSLSKEDLTEAKSVIKHGEKKLESWRIQLEYLKDIGKLKERANVLNAQIDLSNKTFAEIEIMKKLVSNIQYLTRKRDFYSPINDIDLGKIDNELKSSNIYNLEKMLSIFKSWKQADNRFNSLKIINHLPNIENIDIPVSGKMLSLYEKWIKLEQRSNNLLPVLKLKSDIHFNIDNSLSHLVNLKNRWSVLLIKKEIYEPILNVNNVDIPKIKDNKEEKSLLEKWESLLNKDVILKQEIDKINDEYEDTQKIIERDFPVCPTCQRPWDHEHNKKEDSVLSENNIKNEIVEPVKVTNTKLRKI